MMNRPRVAVILLLAKVSVKNISDEAIQHTVGRREVKVMELHK